MVMPSNTLEGGLDSSRQNRRPEEWNNLEASGGQEIDDLLNGVVGAVVGGFRVCSLAGEWYLGGDGSGCWREVRTGVCGRRGRAGLLGLLLA